MVVRMYAIVGLEATYPSTAMSALLPQPKD